LCVGETEAGRKKILLHPEDEIAEWMKERIHTREKLVTWGGVLLALDLDVQGQVKRDGLLVECCGVPAELLDGIDHALADSRVSGLDELNVLSLALLIDSQGQDDFAVPGNNR
jgi:hypothetical protein